MFFRVIVAASLCLGCSKTPPPPPQKPTMTPEERAQLKEELRAELQAELVRKFAYKAPKSLVPGMQDVPVDEPSEVPSDKTTIGVNSNQQAVPNPAGQVVPTSPTEKTEIQPKGNDANAGAVPASEGNPMPSGSSNEPAQPTPPVGKATRSNLTMLRLVVARDVDRKTRTPVKLGSVFNIAEPTKLYAYMVVKNPDAETNVVVEWLKNDKVRSRVELKVGHSTRGWRTWSAIRVQPKSIGEWAVRVSDPKGVVLQEAAFKVAN